MTTDLRVNHPDTFLQRNYRFPGMQIAIPAKDKAADNGEVDSTNDTEARFSSWLDKQIDDDLVENWLESTWGLDEHAPGFDLVGYLFSDEIQALELLEVNVGGPGSSVWAIKTTAGVEELNAVLAQHQAPFVFVGDERAT